MGILNNSRVRMIYSHLDRNNVSVVIRVRCKLVSFFHDNISILRKQLVSLLFNKSSKMFPFRMVSCSSYRALHCFKFEWDLDLLPTNEREIFLCIDL